MPAFKFGAGNETRTRDPDLGKVVLYQLSYSRSAVWLVPTTGRHFTHPTSLVNLLSQLLLSEAAGGGQVLFFGFRRQPLESLIPMRETTKTLDNIFMVQRRLQKAFHEVLKYSGS